MVNWTGSSGAMEVGASLEMITKLSKDLDRRIQVEHLVSDDDSFIRSHLCHTTNGGKMKADVHQPKFLANPSHRI